MTDKDRKKIEERLLQERNRAQEELERADEATRIGTLEDGALTMQSQHQADHGTDTMEQEKALMFLGRESDHLEDIDEALRRLYKEPDRFGVCERCGKDIEMERLDLVPWTTHCIDCQAKIEAAAGTDTGAEAG